MYSVCIVHNIVTFEGMLSKPIYACNFSPRPYKNWLPRLIEITEGMYTEHEFGLELIM